MRRRLGWMGAAALAACAALAGLRAWTDEAAERSIARDSRCFELRTYVAAPGRFEAMHARFRDHTCALFKKHGMTMVGFWVPQEKEKGAETTLVYLLSFPSREAREKSWAAFISDPEWRKVRAESEANGRLVEKLDAVLLRATDYSPLK